MIGRTTANRRILWLLSGVVITVVIFIGLLGFLKHGSQRIYPVHGRLDLQSWNLHRDRPLSLSGKWDYYWERFLNYQEVVNGSPEPDARVDVPEVWNSYKLRGKNLPGFGYATYLLKVVNVSKGNILGYEEVAGLYSGDYLSGMEFTWAEHNRQMQKDQFIRLLLEIAGYYKITGKYQKTVEWLKTGLMHEPLHREINYRLMETLLLTHDRIAAGRYYDIYKNGLRRKMQQEPDDDFKKLLG